MLVLACNEAKQPLFQWMNFVDSTQTRYCWLSRTKNYLHLPSSWRKLSKN